MFKKTKSLGIFAFFALSATAGQSHARSPALLDDPTYFPYETSFTDLDPVYRFEDDLLAIMPDQPVSLHVTPVNRPPVRRTMITPRFSFIPALFESRLGL